MLPIVFQLPSYGQLCTKENIVGFNIIIIGNRNIPQTNNHSSEKISVSSSYIIKHMQLIETTILAFHEKMWYKKYSLWWCKRPFSNAKLIQVMQDLMPLQHCSSIADCSSETTHCKQEDDVLAKIVLRCHLYFNLQGTELTIKNNIGVSYIDVSSLLPTK